jgi:hypothetical protein
MPDNLIVFVFGGGMSHDPHNGIVRDYRTSCGCALCQVRKAGYLMGLSDSFRNRTITCTYTANSLDTAQPSKSGK